MKRLLLMSNHGFFDNYGGDFLSKKFGQLKIAYITTAIKFSIHGHTKQHLESMRASGFIVDEFDLTGQNKNSLLTLFQPYNVIYLAGGNTFYLLKEIKASGFDKIINQLLDAGKIYIGASAGAYVACPTIEMSNWKNSDKDRFGVVDLKALGLIDFLISVHYETQYNEAIKQGTAKTNLSVRLLQDNQALWVEDGKIEFLGLGEEVKIENISV